MQPAAHSATRQVALHLSRWVPPHRRQQRGEAASPEDDVSPELLFLRVPGGEDCHNRLHVDLCCDRSHPSDEG